MQHQLTIPYDDEILVGLNMSPEQFISEARFMLAAKFYEQGKLTSGQAARFCGMDRVMFLLSLPRLGIPVSNLRPDDADIELEFARNG
jgi:predicted HTH domain antitoxin